MKKIFFCTLLLVVYVYSANAQQTKAAGFYCIDHTDSTIYYSIGNAVVKKGLNASFYYQYGFMKWKGWINKSWDNLVYTIEFGKKSKDFIHTNKTTKGFIKTGYRLKEVPMPYPMKPYIGYKTDGTN